MSDQAALDRQKIAKLSERILNNPILFRRLCDRVYDLMKEDALNQSDRNHLIRRFYS
ncbi:MAG: hypothetical protein AAGE59_32810 [Cyanobacteria bacterium P01_F01_bin.86]